MVSRVTVLDCYVVDLLGCVFRYPCPLILDVASSLEDVMWVYWETDTSFIKMWFRDSTLQSFHWFHLLKLSWRQSETANCGVSRCNSGGQYKDVVSSSEAAAWSSSKKNLGSQEMLQDMFAAPGWTGWRLGQAVWSCLWCCRTGGLLDMNRFW